MRIGDGDEIQVGSLGLDQDNLLRGSTVSIDIAPALRELADRVERGGN
jgi:hypothetical protein